jgi:hypothetical protein
VEMKKINGAALGIIADFLIELPMEKRKEIIKELLK